MEINKLQLHLPKIELFFNSSLQDIFEKLEPFGFVLTKREDWHPIIHGEAWITNEDKVVIHFYFTDTGQLDSFMIHSVNYKHDNSILNSFERKQKWLESLFGKPQVAEKNNNYNIFNFSWELKTCIIKHFIQDRYGDEEGIYFDIF